MIVSVVILSITCIGLVTLNYLSYRAWCDKKMDQDIVLENVIHMVNQIDCPIEDKYRTLEVIFQDTELEERVLEMELEQQIHESLNNDSI